MKDTLLLVVVLEAVCAVYATSVVYTIQRDANEGSNGVVSAGEYFNFASLGAVQFTNVDLPRYANITQVRCGKFHVGIHA